MLGYWISSCQQFHSTWESTPIHCTQKNDTLTMLRDVKLSSIMLSFLNKVVSLKDGTFAGRFFLPVWIFVVSQTVFKDLLILYREQSEIEALLWRTWCNAHYSHKYLIFSPFLSVEWRQKNALNRETWPARHAFHRSLMNWMINTQLFCIFKGSLNIAFTYPKLNSHIPILYERVLFCYF